MSLDIEDVLARARSAEPASPADLDRIRRGLDSKLAALAAGSSAAAMKAGAGSTLAKMFAASSAFKGVAVLLLVVPIVWGGMAARNSSEAPPRAAEPISISRHAIATASAAPVAAGLASEASVRVEPARELDAAPSTPSAARPSQRPPNADVAAATDAPSVVSEPALRVAETNLDAVTPPVPTAEPPRTPAAGLAEEVALIRHGQAALRAGDFTAALALFGAHAAQFPTGALQEERLSGEIAAHCLRGDPHAVERARSFVTRHSKSLSVPQVQRSCWPAGPR